MLLKKIVIFIFTAIILSNIAYAEGTSQNMQKYRQVFNDNQYYMEYVPLDIKTGKESEYGYAIARDGDKHMKWSRSMSNGAFFSKNKKLEPNYYYEDDTFYSFRNNMDEIKLVIYGKSDYIRKNNYNAIIHWRSVIDGLAIPEILVPLMGENQFNNNRENITEAVYERSSTQQFNGHNCKVDIFYSDVSNPSGKVLFKRYYYYYYEKDQLLYAKMTISAKIGHETVKEIIAIKKIEDTIPDKFYKWKKESKMANIDGESMNILLDDAIRF